jgi:lysophospholipase L1-like esterase
MKINRPNQRWSFCGLAALAIVAILAAPAGAQPENRSFNFDFGIGPIHATSTKVAPDAVYSHERGYGFEPGADIKLIERSGDDASQSGSTTSDKPFYFSVAVPEGNYRVTVRLGSRVAASTTTIKAELRRLMLENINAEPGQFEIRSFIVNVRTPQIPGDKSVGLKTREKTSEAWAWDDKLTLEFNGAQPSLASLEICPADDLPTIYLMGDSTVCDQSAEPWNSWGQMLTRFFKPEVAIANHAESGDSLRSALSARRLNKVTSTMKPGDYLFIQYGHNDMKEKGEGVGAYTTYKTDLERFVAAARQHGATPVLVTSMNRKSLDSSGKVTNTLGNYPEAVRQVAKEQNVPLIDLHAMSRAYYEALGPDNINRAFVDDTHHNSYGSYELAKCVVQGIRDAKLDLTKYLVDDLPAFDPSHPDAIDNVHIPDSPIRDPARPAGN